MVDAGNLPLKFGQNLVSNIKDVIDVVVNVVIFVVVVHAFFCQNLARNSGGRW